MTGRSITLFELLGFKIRVDASWLFLALLVTWSLAAGVFPAQYQGYEADTYWWMGIAGMIGLVVSLIFHELAHSVVARHYGLSIKGITLFIFGGVAEMAEEPKTAKIEFLMAIAGPIASFFLALCFHFAGQFSTAQGLPVPFIGVLKYLAFINMVLGGFNLIPAFPLDGGRVLRAALWYLQGDLRQATRIASNAGKGFGMAMMILGAFYIINGHLIGGLWWFVIGIFLRAAAESTFQQLLTRRIFEGEPVRRFMTHETVAVSPELSLLRFVEDYVYEYHFDLFPVVFEARLIGCVGIRQLKSVPRQDWDRVAVGDVMSPCSDENTIDPGMDAIEAMALMRQTGASRLIVAVEDRLVGIVALKDMLELFNLKMDLENSR